VTFSLELEEAKGDKGGMSRGRKVGAAPLSPEEQVAAA